MGRKKKRIQHGGELVELITEKLRQWYGDKERRDGTRAIDHPIRVAERVRSIASLLREHQISRTRAILASLLHDVKEDCPVKVIDGEQYFSRSLFEQIEHELSGLYAFQVESVVNAVTEPMTIPLRSTGGYRRESRDARYRYFEEVAKEWDTTCCLVKLADYLDNLKGMENSTDPELRTEHVRRMIKTLVNRMSENGHAAIAWALIDNESDAAEIIAFAELARPELQPKSSGVSRTHTQR